MRFLGFLQDEKERTGKIEETEEEEAGQEEEEEEVHTSGGFFVWITL